MSPTDELSEEIALLQRRRDRALTLVGALNAAIEALKGEAPVPPKADPPPATRQLKVRSPGTAPVPENMTMAAIRLVGASPGITRKDLQETLLSMGMTGSPEARKVISTRIGQYLKRGDFQEHDGKLYPAGSFEHLFG